MGSSDLSTLMATLKGLLGLAPAGVDEKFVGSSTGDQFVGSTFP
ncbi:hypothetical protein [Rhodococcus daqingensis]|uniref:Uncharacterized protein n=1 Tax=Rhodococcus daqingensis TaxID=2479363 RepID=A0ABW2RZ78_9NOCA